MIGAPNNQTLNCTEDVMNGVPGTSVSAKIADIFRKHYTWTQLKSLPLTHFLAHDNLYYMNMGRIHQELQRPQSEHDDDTIFHQCVSWSHGQMILKIKFKVQSHYKQQIMQGIICAKYGKNHPNLSLILDTRIDMTRCAIFQQFFNESMANWPGKYKSSSKLIAWTHAVMLVISVSYGKNLSIFV